MVPLLVALAAQDPVGTSSWPEIAGGLAAVATLLTILGGALALYVRYVVRRESGPARRAAQKAVEQTATSNGHSAGELIEATAATVEQLRRMADANRARIEALDARLDRHIIAGHRAE